MMRFGVLSVSLRAVGTGWSQADTPCLVSEGKNEQGQQAIT